MFPLIFGKRTAISTIVFVVADYKLALYEHAGSWRVPASDALDDEMPSETGIRAVLDLLGIAVRFVEIHNVPQMRTDAQALPLPFHIDEMAGKDGRHCQFYYIATSMDGKAHNLRPDARWFGKDELTELAMHETYREMCKRAFEIYFELDL
jgi:hypothetical protein